MNINELTEQVIGAAMEVHSALGPGLLESAYEGCLALELAQRGLPFERQKPLPIRYKTVSIDAAYRIDLLVAREVVVELKAVAKIESVHEAQVLSYLKLSGCCLALLINFNVRHLRNGIRRFVNGLPP